MRKVDNDQCNGKT